MESPSISAATRKNFAYERLLRDQKEILSNPLPTICAEPVNDNYFLWHANLIGVNGTDYEGTCIHMEIIFPPDYPMHPPKVKLLTTVVRDHVFGEWICLDMLQSWSGFSNQKYTGWTTAYSLQSILLQLQAFIFESEKEARTLSIRNACINAAKYKCTGCHHNMAENKPWPFREGMQKPLTVAETEQRFAGTFKRQYEKDEELDGRPKPGRGKPISAELARMYAEEGERMKKQMQEEIQRRRQKAQQKELEEQRRKEKALAKQLEEQKEQKKDNYIPGDDSSVKTKKPKQKQKQPAPQQTTVAPVTPLKPEEPKKKVPVFTQKDSMLNTLWHTKLNPLAPAFVPMSKRQEVQPVPQIQQHNPPPHIKNIVEFVEYQNVFEMLPFEVLYMIFANLKDPLDLDRCQRVCWLWRNVLLGSHIIERRETICFHSKRTFEEDVLGVGISLQTHPKSGDIQYVTTRLDLLSSTAFYLEGIRQSVWQEPFTHWVPIFINRAHAKRAMPYLHQELANIYAKPFEPWMAIDLFSKLMNTMVVSVMSGKTHASIVALTGYCYFHRLLIEFVHEYPELKEWINKRVQAFVSDEYYRHKRQCASMGDFLPLLTVSDYTWSNVAVPVVKETLARNVLWIAKQHPNLGKVQPQYNAEVEKQRAIKSFKVSTTSLRLIMFHVYFLNSVAKVGKVKPEVLAKEYDKRYGRPDEAMQTKLQKEIFKIQAVSDYKGYFRKVKLPEPSDEFLHQLLREAVIESSRKRYHKDMPQQAKEEPQTKKKPQRAALNTDDLDDY